jgi:hypothetical protein
VMAADDEGHTRRQAAAHEALHTFLKIYPIVVDYDTEEELVNTWVDECITQC